MIDLDAPILSHIVHFFLVKFWVRNNLVLGDDINAIFCRGFYSMNGEEEAWWESLEEEIKGKAGQPFEEVLSVVD